MGDISNKPAPRSVFLLTFEPTSLTPSSAVLKLISADQERAKLSQGLGLAREALFYLEQKHAALPVIYFAEGDMKAGTKTIVMVARCPRRLERLLRRRDLGQYIISSM